MKNKATDILKDRQQLKKMPYNVPDGYFDGLQQSLKTAGEKDTAYAPWNRAVRYISIAAVFALIVATGTILIDRNLAGEEFSEEDYIVFSDDMTNAIYYELSEQYAENHEMTQEEISEYLISTGEDIEYIYTIKNLVL